MTAEVIGMIQMQLFAAWAFVAGLAGLLYMVNRYYQQKKDRELDRL